MRPPSDLCRVATGGPVWSAPWILEAVSGSQLQVPAILDGMDNEERMAAIEVRYADDPAALETARFREFVRRYAEALGLCPECMAKFPDPLDKSTL